MKGINITGALVVLLCNLVVSYNHSIQLFESGGFRGWMAHVAVVAAETTFILGALNLVVARTRGNPPGAPTILGGLLGVALVSWSNVSAGWEHGITGILLGLATPASLIVAEAILSRAIIQQRGENPESVGDSTAAAGEKVGEEPDGLGDPPAMVGEIREPLEESPTDGDTVTQGTGESPEPVGEIPETGKESPGKARELVGDHPPQRQRFTPAEIEEMAAQIHNGGESPTKREIMAKFGISDYYARKVMKALGEMNEAQPKGGMENEKDRNPARISTPAHGKQSHSHFTTDDSTEGDKAFRPGA